MKLQRTLLAIALSGCFIGGQTAAAPLLQHDPMTTTQRIDKSNAWVEIDRAAFLHNIVALQQQIGDSKVCAVIKADAYGHGVDLLMPSLIKSGVPCLGFASNEEARTARKHGYKGLLMRVRTGSLDEVRDAVRYGVEELVGNLAFATEVAAIARKAGKTLRVHLCINANGLSRNGIELASEQGKRDALALVALKGLKVSGLMTHYPVEEKDDVRRNLALFLEQSSWLIAEGHLQRKQLILHTANSYAALEVPEARLDMVRAGGAIYGDTVPDYKQYQRVMSFKTSVATVNSYPAGNTVGYDRTLTLKRDSRLANLPMGYSDGYRRIFTNKAFVLIRGHRVPVVGRVSMNTTMIDVTDFPDILSGDEVVLFGKQGGAEVTQEELENMNGALLADLYTVWGNSNPRVLK